MKQLVRSAQKFPHKYLCIDSVLHRNKKMGTEEEEELYELHIECFTKNYLAEKGNFRSFLKLEELRECTASSCIDYIIHKCFYFVRYTMQSDRDGCAAGFSDFNLNSVRFQF